MSYGHGHGADALLDEVLERYRDADAALRRCRSSPSRDPKLERRAEQTLLEATRLAASLTQDHPGEDATSNRHHPDPSSGRLWSEILSTQSLARELQSENVELRRQLGEFESSFASDVRYDGRSSVSSAHTMPSLPRYDVPGFIREKEVENDRLRAQLHQLRAEALAASSTRIEARQSYAGMYSLPRRLLQPLSPPPLPLSAALHPSPWLDRDRRLADEVRRHELKSAACYDQLMADRTLRHATLRSEPIGDPSFARTHAAARPSVVAPPLSLRGVRPSEILDAYLARFRDDHQRFIASAMRADVPVAGLLDAAARAPWTPRSSRTSTSLSRLDSREGAGCRGAHAAEMMDSASRWPRSPADFVGIGRTPTLRGVGLHSGFGAHPLCRPRPAPPWPVAHSLSDIACTRV